jgi:hypothetical protein
MNIFNMMEWILSRHKPYDTIGDASPLAVTIAFAWAVIGVAIFIKLMCLLVESVEDDYEEEHYADLQEKCNANHRDPYE